MKNRFVKPIAVLVAVLMLLACFVSCASENGDETSASGQNTQTQNGGDDTTKPIDTAGRLLSSFATVRAVSSSSEVTDAAVLLNKTVARIAGGSRGVKVDENAKDGNEIVIGATKRAESAYLGELSFGDYVFKTSIDSEGRCTVLVGGYDDSATAKAVTEFIEYLEEQLSDAGEGAVMPDMNIKSNVSELVVADDVAKRMVIVYPKNADSRVSKAVTLLKKDIAKSLGISLKAVTAASSDDISKYPNAIIIGAAGKEATDIKDSFAKKNTYTVSVDITESGTRVYIVGGSNLSTVRAIQYFYSKSVVNGNFRIPIYLDVTTNPLTVRDPGVLLHNGKYYMYSTNGAGYVVRVSEDLLTWSSPRVVWKPEWQEISDAQAYFWAPECHYYNGYFYLFTTYGHEGGSNGRKGCVIMRCATPDGKFVLISKQSANATEPGWITPESMNAIDGTLYVDEQGKPWMVFVREWTMTSDSIGRMSYAPLSDDLTHFTALPTDMFKANDPSWSNYKITDGPWLYKTTDGSLLMIWSNSDTNMNYTVGIAKSSNGRLDGTWTQLDPLYQYTGDNVYEMTDGGHGCIFRDYDGRLYLALHTVNNPDTYITTDSEYTDTTDVTAVTYIPIVESGGTLVLDFAKEKT